MTDGALLPAEAAVARIAARQKGLITRAQLRACGVSDSGVGRWVAKGRLHRVFHAVYAVGHPSLLPFARELAAVLACGKGTLVTHQSGTALWAMTKPRPGPVDVTVPRQTVRRVEGIRIHRPTEQAARTTHHGVPTTTPARTLLDYAAQATPDQLDRAINEACALGLTTTKQLLSLCEQSGARPGAARVRAALHAYDGLTRSEAERELQRLIAAAGLPAPQTNRLIEGKERDFMWPEHGVIVELDGFTTHQSPRSFERDHEEATGWRTTRITARQLRRREQVAARLARALYAP